MQIWLNVTAAFVLIKSFPMDSSFLIAFFSWIDTLLKIEFMIASKNTFQVTYIFFGPVSIYSLYHPQRDYVAQDTIIS